VRGPEAQQAQPLGSAGGTVRRRGEQPEAAADRFFGKRPLNPIPFNQRSGIEALAGGEPPEGSGPALFEKVLPKPLDSGAGRRENGKQAAGLTLRF